MPARKDTVSKRIIIAPNTKDMRVLPDVLASSSQTEKVWKQSVKKPGQTARKELGAS